MLLDFQIILPLAPLSWVPAAAALLALASLYVVALLRSAVDSVSDAEARMLHNRRSKYEQRVYKFFKRKEKVKASLSSAEMLLMAVVVLCAMSMIRIGGGGAQRFALVDFGEGAVAPWGCFFVALAFVLVIAVVLPGRMVADTRKSRLLMRWGWLVEAVCAVMGPLTFCNAYSNRDEESDNHQLSVAIGAKNDQIAEKEIIQNILQFGDIEVREIMTPRHSIVAVQGSAPFSQIKKTVVESNFSRLPVYESTPDTIFGIVYVKDLLKHVGRGDDFDWTKLIRRITYVSENKKISDLLKEFQQKKTHMAAVCDEYAGISGLITMQDILEKIVGEISDEFDEEDDGMYIQKDDNYYVFDGRILLGDFCRVMKIDDDVFDDVKGDAESLAGLLLEMRGEFPDPNVPIMFRNYTFSVEKFSGRRIEKIGVRF